MKSKTRSAGKSPAPVFQLKVTLTGTKPPIWRRLQVPGDANLGWLHAVLQVALGWTNSHLHHFIFGQERYTDLSTADDGGFGDESGRDEGEALLTAVAEAGAIFAYEYDFGDSWEHLVEVEKELPPDPAVSKAAVCLAGARACPPEDCGGVWGYADLQKILKNPKHPEHRRMKGWLGRPLDVEAFDVAEVNAWLKRLKWPRVTEGQLRPVLMARTGYCG